MTRKDDLFDQDNASDGANEAAAEQAAAEQEVQPYTGETPGQILRAAREAKGLSTQQLADSLRLRNAVVEMIEADDYDKLSSPTFVRGYLRSFSKALEVDEKRVFEAYRAMGFGEVAASTITMQSFSKRKVRERNDSRLMLISYLIIAIVIAMAVLWWWQDSNASGQAENLANQMFGTEQVSEADADARTPVSRRVTEEQARRSNGAGNTDTTDNVDSSRDGGSNGSADSSDASHDVVSSTEDSNDTSNDTSNAAQTVTEQPRNSGSSNQQDTAQRSESSTNNAENSPESGQIISEAPSDSTNNSADELELTFSEACWVKVTDANAEVIAIGTKAEGYTMPVAGQAPFDIILCKPEAVTMTYNGEQVDLSGYRRSRSVTMTLN